MRFEISALYFRVLHYHPLIGAQKVCDELEKENIFLVPLEKGIRLAVCSVSKKKIHGLAAKIKATFDAVGVQQ